MKSTLAMVLVIVLGIALGTGTAVLRIRMTPWHPDRGQHHEATPAPAVQSHEPAPKVVVGETEHDFGTLDIESSGSHDFVFTNAGRAPLTLTSGGTSCRCTMSKLGQEHIPPGGSAKVTITWKPTDKPGPYRQTAKILTNDPLRREVVLTISGRITMAFRFSPSELVFTRMSVGEASTGRVKLLCYLDGPLKIVSRKWSDPATAEYFQTTQQPLSAEELKGEPTARSGVLITVTVKPGLAQGPFKQSLLVQSNLASSRVLTLPIEGIVGSEIAVVGHGWNADTGILYLGEVARSAGMQRRLMLVVRGPLRKDVTFKPVRIAPDMLKVTLGQRSEINNGAVFQTPLIIDIPPGSPPANHLGSEQGQLGEITLETTHPQVPKLRIFVRFAIEG